MNFFEDFKQEINKSSLPLMNEEQSAGHFLKVFLDWRDFETGLIGPN
jgi:hypothetical protein